MPARTDRRPPATGTALAEDLHLLFDQRSRGRGFTPADLDVAADVVVEYLTSRGMLPDTPPTLMVLQQQWPGHQLLSTLHLSLVDAQTRARRAVVTRRRGVLLPPALPWVEQSDELGRPTWTWHAITHRTPLARFTIVQADVQTAS